MREAMLWEPLPEGAVVCNLCAHRCKINEGKFGICTVRFNEGGKLITAVDDTVCAAHVDPIEKKPFFHFMPGSRSFSVATVGCNMRCKHCQNWEISQYPKDKARRGEIFGEKVTPEQVVAAAVRTDSATIAYTYTDPVIFMELAYSIAPLAHDAGIKNLFVTSGYMTPEALDIIGPYLDGVNVDLKGFDEKKYVKVCGTHLEHVLDNIRWIHERGIWLEVTTLVIPGHNDSDEEFRGIAEFIAGVDPSIPWHVTAFHPDFKMLDVSATPPETLHRAHGIGKDAGLDYVYSGNVLGDDFEDTYCPSCGSKIIDRFGHGVRFDRVKNSKCPDCLTPIVGVGLH